MSAAAMVISVGLLDRRHAQIHQILFIGHIPAVQRDRAGFFHEIEVGGFFNQMAVGKFAGVLAAAHRDFVVNPLVVVFIRF